MLEINGVQHKVILLDTNMIRECLSNISFKDKLFDFLTNDGSEYIICISIYNVVELLSDTERFNKFLNIFSTIRCFIIYPYKTIIEEEFKSYKKNENVLIKNLGCITTPQNENPNSTIKKFLSDFLNDETMHIILKELDEIKHVAIQWNKNRFEHPISKSYTIKTLMIKHESGFIESFLREFLYSIENSKDLELFYSIRTMLFSQLFRIYFTNNEISKNDVMDVEISSIVPYIDGIITENTQAEILKQLKRYINKMSTIDIYTMRDIK